MPDQFQLPDCMMKGLRLIFPKINWDRVTFYDDNLFPYFITNPNSKAKTIPRAFGDIRIYFKGGYVDFCSEAFYRTLVHELVHVVQIQGEWAPWIQRWKYMTCHLVEGYRNCGRTWLQKVTFERTQQQPSLAASETSLFVGWTGTDDQLNVFASPAKTKAVLERSGPCGPALATSNTQIFLGWKGSDDHPNCISTFDAVNFGAKFTSGGDGPRESNVGLAFGRDMIYMAWVGPDNFIRLIHMRAENPIREEPIKVHKLNHKTGHKCTPALAFGNGELFMAWSRFAPSPFLLNIMRIPVDPDGFVIDFDQELHRQELTDFTNDTTGPALAYGSQDDLLYLAFTGADDGVYVMSINPTTLSRVDIRRLENEASRSDAGPGVTVHPSTGTVFVCWVGKDGD